MKIIQQQIVPEFYAELPEKKLLGLSASCRIYFITNTLSMVDQPCAYRYSYGAVVRTRVLSSILDMGRYNQFVLFFRSECSECIEIYKTKNNTKT